MTRLVEKAPPADDPITPLLRVPFSEIHVFAKCEFRAPSGSHKYRVYGGIIDALERDESRLRHGDTLVDFTSGNGGIALAQVARERGYRACVVAPATISREKLAFMQSLGAEIHSVSPSAPYGYIGPDDLLRARLMAARIAEERGFWFLDQANNPANVLACQEIGREICAQLAECPTHLICGIGTGGAITGIATVMKARFPALRVIGVEPAESTTVVARLHHESPHHVAHRLSGLGPGEISASLDVSLLDDAIAVTEPQWSAELTRLNRAGLRVGKSSAAGMAGAAQISKFDSGAVCVTVFFDSLERYDSEFETVNEVVVRRSQALPHREPEFAGRGHVDLRTQRGSATSSIRIDIMRLGERLTGEPASFSSGLTLAINDRSDIDGVFESLTRTPFVLCDSSGAQATPSSVRANWKVTPATFVLANAYATVKVAIRAMYEGRPIIVLDEREEEGDFFLACAKATPEAVNLMLKEGRGVLCVAMRPDRFRELDIRSARDFGSAYNETPFGESVDYLVGTTTGVSAVDRCRTIRALASANTQPSQLRRNGHLRTLEAHEGGILSRRGHTEAAVEMAALAGLPAATALIEILTPEGAIARQRHLFNVAKRLDVPIIRVAQIHAHIAATVAL